MRGHAWVDVGRDRKRKGFATRQRTTPRRPSKQASHSGVKIVGDHVPRPQAVPVVRVIGHDELGEGDRESGGGWGGMKGGGERGGEGGGRGGGGGGLAVWWPANQRNGGSAA